MSTNPTLSPGITGAPSKLGNRSILVLSERANEEILSQHFTKLDRITASFSDIFHSIKVITGITSRQNFQGSTTVSNKVVLETVCTFNRLLRFPEVLSHSLYLISVFFRGIGCLREDTNIVIVTNSWGHVTLGLIAIILSKVTHRKAMIRVTGDSDINLINVRKRFGVIAAGIFLIIQSRIERFVFDEAAMIVSVSEAIRIKYGKFSQKIVIIPNVFPIIDEYCAKDLIPIFDDKVARLVYVGRLEPEKGIDILLRALKDLKEFSLNRFSCNVIGDGRMRNQLESDAIQLGISNLVSFVGLRPQDEVYAMMSKSDLLVLPSYTEYTPNVLIEAATIGLPIIASRVGGIPYIIQDGKTGFLFEKGDHLELARHINFLINNHDIAESFRREGKKIMCERFTTHSIKDAYFRSLSKLLGSSYV